MIVIIEPRKSTHFFSLPYRYTLTKASPSSPMVLETLEEDASVGYIHQKERSAIRRHGRTVDPSSSGAYRLVRSVDLDNCRERVFTAKASKCIE